MASPIDVAWIVLKGDCVGKENNCSCKECVRKAKCSCCGQDPCRCGKDCPKCGGMKKAQKKDPRLARAGVSGYNKPKRTPNHAKKSHIVVARSGGKVKTIRFGQQGKSGAGANPKTPKEKARQKSFKARHAKNISRGPMSAAYWADKVKW